ncbi:hypothetical protein P4361_06950 [Fictibacillus sp. B-59209]|uniref:hypothetical protein n=1 Tax=Fictibacillus sp. B-59209 TaxID=3024873 RepID=UPI002E20713B|nr:hypothetical protein [Fictibacillus sp. B-59209]
MHDARQSALVRNTLLHMLCPPGEKVPYVLSLLTYHFTGMEEGLALLREAGKSKIRLEVFTEKILFRHFTKEHLAGESNHDAWYLSSSLTEDKLRMADCILIPVLSFSLAGDLLRFNDQREFVRIILQALLSGKKVAALPYGNDPFHEVFRSKELDRGSEYLKTELHKTLFQLKKLGVTLLRDGEGLASWLNDSSQKQSVISEADILSAAKAQKKLLIAEEHAIITPLARDAAKQYGIKISRQ